MAPTKKKGNGDILRVNIGMLTIAVLMVGQLIGFAYAYGALTEQVNTNRVLIEQNRVLQIDVTSKLDAFNVRLTRIETTLSLICETSP